MADSDDSLDALESAIANELQQIEEELSLIRILTEIRNDPRSDS